MSDITKQQLELLHEYQLTHEQYLRLYALVSDLRSLVNSDAPSLEEMFNVVYVIREMTKFQSDIQKELNVLRELYEKVICVLHTRMALTDPKIGENIKTALGTGTPHVHMKASLPTLKREPEEYKALMKYFGVTEDMATRDYLRPYWPRVQEHIDELASEGKPLPSGIDTDATYPTYSVRVVPRTDLDEFICQLSAKRDELRKEADDRADEWTKKYLNERTKR